MKTITAWGRQAGRISAAAVIGLTSLLIGAGFAHAAGVGASGGGTYTVGQSFTVSIVASGTTFNAFQGTIHVSGPVTTSVSAGGADWAPGGTPSANGTFEGGITSPATSFTIARLTLKGTAVGSGSVKVSGVELVNNGSVVATGGGSTNFTINRAPTPPGTVTVTSLTNPDPTQSYGVTTVTVTWTAPTNGATGYAMVFDQTATTTPPETANTTALTATFDNLAIGTYYFHIRADNGDGWGPTTTFQVNLTQAIDNGLRAPKFTAVEKLSTFKTSITAGTVTGFAIDGTSAGLKGYTITLTMAPAAAIPSAQALTTTVNAAGQWSVVFNQPIPAGFYQVSAIASNSTTATDASPVTDVELAVADGGIAKIITNADLPQPNVAVKVAGVTFVSASAYHRTLGIGIGALVLAALLGGFGTWLFGRWRRRPVHQPSNHPTSSHTPPRINL